MSLSRLKVLDRPVIKHHEIAITGDYAIALVHSDFNNKNALLNSLPIGILVVNRIRDARLTRNIVEIK